MRWEEKEPLNNAVIGENTLLILQVLILTTTMLINDVCVVCLGGVECSGTVGSPVDPQHGLQMKIHGSQKAYSCLRARACGELSIGVE